LWNARIVAGELVRYTPEGEIVRRIPMPVPWITSVMFGGDDLDVIYVTSMGKIDFLGPDAQAHFGNPEPKPNAGGIFAVSGTGVRGLPENRFGG